MGAGTEERSAERDFTPSQVQDHEALAFRHGKADAGAVFLMDLPCVGADSSDRIRLLGTSDRACILRMPGFYGTVSFSSGLPHRRRFTGRASISAFVGFAGQVFCLRG